MFIRWYICALYADHTLSLDTQRLELLCRYCKDYVYLETFDEALLVGHSFVKPLTGV
jgi:hypothetical protein